MKGKIILVFIVIMMISSVFASAININVHELGNNEIEEQYDKQINKETQSATVKDGTKSPISSGDEVDQENDFSNDGALFIWEEVCGAQSFKPTLSILTRVELHCGESSPIEDVIVSIRSSLDGDDLTSISVEPGNLPSDDWYMFDFPDISVTPETPYFIVMRSDDPYTDYRWSMDDQNNYQRGEGWYWKNDCGWHGKSMTRPERW